MSENRYRPDPPRRKKHWKPVALLDVTLAVPPPPAGTLPVTTPDGGFYQSRAFPVAP